MGKLMGETFLDERGRILIPKGIRKNLGLKPNQRLTIKTRGDEIIVKPSITVTEFSKELRGCVHGSRIKPTKLKEIWGILHAHH